MCRHVSQAACARLPPKWYKVMPWVAGYRDIRDFAQVVPVEEDSTAEAVVEEGAQEATASTLVVVDGTPQKTASREAATTSASTGTQASSSQATAAAATTSAGRDPDKYSSATLRALRLHGGV